MKLNYQKRLELCFVAILCFFILLLFIFQKFQPNSFKISETKYPEIIVVEIPRTIQHIAKRLPKPSMPSIIVPVDEPEILDEIELNFEDIKEVIPSDKIFLADELEGLPYIPRQILEVLPEQSDEKYQGKIILSLWIDKKGKAKDHKVLMNTTGSKECLDHVLKAAYKSKWQPVVIDSNIYEYWIEKTYVFN
jgi:hypothetical protein